MKTRIIPLVTLLATCGATAFFGAGCAATTGKSTGEYIDDATTTAKVKAELIRDPIVKARQIDVDTNAGVVLLKGTVDSPEQRARAEQIARAVSGVQGVQDDLAVRGQ